MTGLTTSWKIFRVICILQLVLVATQLMLSIVGIFYNYAIFYNIVEVILYSSVFFFVYLGFSILNYNFPDTPLSDKQKSQFNWLYIINFLLIAYLFAQVVNKWWILPVLQEAENIKFLSWLNFASPLLLSMVIFFFHLLLLAGMFRMRRVLHQNTIDTWYQQFEEKKQE